MPRIRWTERSFRFDFPADLYPEMIERLRGTPARLEDRLEVLEGELLIRRDGDAWSIQEHAGHLLDLESLVWRRLDEYEASADALHAADMSNRKTWEARHNERLLAAVLTAFRREREAIVARLERWPPEVFARSALHPRLQVAMRLTDMLFFQAEHDDYHLARISELIRRFT
jgi:uncharacterized damage-inducible protein DinB